MIVTIRPLNRNSWAGVIRYKNCYEMLGSYWTRTGRRYTGFDESKPEDVLKRKEIEEKIGVDLRPESTFWDAFNIKFGRNELYLDTTDTMDELRYIFLKNHKKVMPSLNDRKPTADYVIINKDEEAKEVNKINRVRHRAIREFAKLTPDEMRKALRIFGHNANQMTNEIVENTLSEIIESNPDKFLEKWVDNDHRDTENILEEAIAKNVIRKNKNIYKYGSDIIGHSQGEAIQFLDTPTNQDIRTVILKELKIKS